MASSPPARQLTDKELSVAKTFFVTFTIVAILWWAWVMAGIVAFIWSLYCLGKSGTAADKIVGVILAILVGPLYFLFVRLNKRYCK